MYLKSFPDEVARQKAIEQAILDLGDLAGRLCVYVEGGTVYLVRVGAVGIDGWGLRLFVQIVPAPGFDPCKHDRWEATACWETVSVFDRGVNTSIWTLLTRSDVVQSVASAAAQGLTGHDLALHVYEMLYAPPHLE